MSKVLDYLPYAIPIILINCNKVAPLTLTPLSSNCFRDGYVFDVCLLGDCNAVVAAPTQVLGWDQDNTVSSNPTPEQYRLANTADGRTLLFSGATKEEEP